MSKKIKLQTSAPPFFQGKEDARKKDDVTVIQF